MLNRQRNRNLRAAPARARTFVQRVVTPKLKSLYIAVRPVGSKFAKALQSSIRERVNNLIYRVDHQVGNRKERDGKAVFRITAEPLNKIQQLTRFRQHGVSCPNFTTDPAKVRDLGSKTVFARQLVNATGGRGIVEFEVQAGPPPRAPLYTAYIPKKAEFRLHVFDGRVVDIQQKRKKREFNVDERDTRVRNLANGYVYCRDNLQPPAGINNLAIAAVHAVGYRYGAVDIVYNEKNNQSYVLEVNSRPGLMGTTLDKYAGALIDSYQLRRK